jgi:DNA-binding FadR family transcriptional regulator
MAATIPVRVSRAEAVARELESEILAGVEPGIRIGTKEELRQRFGVAVATVNEAVRLLELRGLITVRPGPGGGVFVARPAVRVALTHIVLGLRSDAGTYEEMLEVRDALEPAVCLAAAREHRASDIRDLSRIVDAMEAASSDPARYFVENFALHRRIARIGGNTSLRSIYLTVLDYLEATTEESEFDAFDGAGAVAVHRALVEAIDSGDEKALDRALKRHRPLPARSG